jgi:membrane protease YdiL (CAAX protease family)
MKGMARFNSQIALLAAVVTIVWSEILLVQGQYLSGILLYSLILLVLLIYGAYRWEHPQRFLVVLVIPSIIRILNFTLPLGDIAPLFAQVVISIPLILVGFVYVWLFNEDRSVFVFKRRELPAYLVMIGLGAVVGLLLYQFKQPIGLMWNSALLFFFFAFVLVATAFLEEWLYRGIMQTGLTRLMGRDLAGLVVSILYTTLQINHNSWMFIAVIFVFSWGLSWLRSRTYNLLYVCLIHGAANLMFFLILPQ